MHVKLMHVNFIHVKLIRRIAAAMKACRILVESKVGEKFLSIEKRASRRALSKQKADRWK
ncbi:hypothetical protein ABE485_12375 [Achromobacter spanius]|uniref:hypothetical protein n=1 Tax=Achromobacter spanius TaxID=217203 RepID=UPI00320867A3